MEEGELNSSLTHHWDNRGYCHFANCRGCELKTAVRAAAEKNDIFMTRLYDRLCISAPEI